MKHQLTLEVPGIDFDDTAFLSILTDTPGFALADDMNHLYDLSLHRTDDADLGGVRLPLYMHSDVMRHLNYYLVELKGAADGYLMIVRGSMCNEVVQAMEADFNSPLPEPHPADLPAVRRCQILERYQQAFTPVSIVSFSDGEIQTANTAARRALKGRPGLVDLFARILDFIDISMFDAE